MRGELGGYDVGYDECYCTTKFETAPGCLDIARLSDATVPPSYDQSKQQKLSKPISNHRAKLLLGPADVGSVGWYGVGYDECSCTTHLATAVVCLDIARVFDAMVPPADDQSKQHTLSTTTSHHQEKFLLRPADVGIVEGDDVGYYECYHTTKFVTAPGRLYIVHHTHVAATAATGKNVSESMVPPTDYTTMDPIVDLPNSHVNDVPLSTIATASEDAAIGTSVSEAMVTPDVRHSTITAASASVVNGPSVSEAVVPPADDQ